MKLLNPQRSQEEAIAMLRSVGDRAIRILVDDSDLEELQYSRVHHQQLLYKRQQWRHKPVIYDTRRHDRADVEHVNSGSAHEHEHAAHV